MQITADQPIVFIKEYLTWLVYVFMGDEGAQQEFFRKKNLLHATDAGI
jgi:hypothetical protein